MSRPDAGTCGDEVRRRSTRSWCAPGSSCGPRATSRPASPAPTCMVIKPSGVGYDDLRPEDDGGVRPRRRGGRGRPGAVERHRVARATSTATCPRWAAWSTRTRPTRWPGPPGARRCPACSPRWPTSSAGEIPVAPFALIGTDAIGKAVVDALRTTRSPAVLVQNHGPFTVGADARAAVKAAVMCEDVCRTVHIARQLGEPKPIDPGRRRPPLRPLPERLRTTGTPMTDPSPFDELEVWFLTGSQGLYGDETLAQVAAQAGEVVRPARRRRRRCRSASSSSRS